MKRWIVGLALCGAGMAGISGSATAQQFAAEGATSKDLQVWNKALMDRPVTVDIHGQPLEAVLQTITANAKVPLQYRGGVFDRYQRPVTLRLVKIPLGAALQRALAGTSLQIVPDGPGRLVVVEAVLDSTSVLTGTVVMVVKNRQDGSPVKGANVSVANSNRTAQEHQGTYRMELPAGNNVVQVRALAFTRWSQSVAVTAGVTTTVEVLLDRVTNVLSEVVVTGTVVATERRAIPNPITVITGEELEKRGITRIEQLFRGEVPGLFAMEVGTERYGLSSDFRGAEQGLGAMVRTPLYSRGSPDGNANPIKTYVDGVELDDPSYLGTLDPQSIERIEIITGPQAATVYGSGAMGGVMQVFTKKGYRSGALDLTLTNRYGVLQSNLSSSKTPTHNNILGLAGGTGASLSYSGTATHNYTGQWQPRLFARSMSLSLGASYQNGAITVNPNASFSMSANGTYGVGPYCMGSVLTSCSGGILEQTMRESGEWKPGYLDRLRSDRISRSTGQILSLNIDHKITSYWQQHLTIGRSQTQSELDPIRPGLWESGDTLYRTSESQSARITAGYNTTFLDRASIWTSSLTVGANGSWGGGSTLTGCQVDPSSSVIVDCWNAEVKGTKLTSRQNWGGFGSWRIGLWDQLYLTLGLRGERNPNYGRQHKVDWTPTNGITYSVDAGPLTVKVLASYGRATRAPAPDARQSEYSSVGAGWYMFEGKFLDRYLSRAENPLLGPETSRGPQGGLEVYYGSVASFTVNRYRQVTDEMIQLAPFDSLIVWYVPGNYEWVLRTNQYQNVGKTLSAGWEGTGSLTVGPVSIKGVYSWNDTRVIYNANSYYFRGYRYNHVPDHTANVSVGYAHGATSALLSTNWVGRANIGYQTAHLSLVRLQMYQQRAYNAPGVMRPGYAKSNLNVSHRVNAYITGTLQVTNLTDNYGSEVSMYTPALGRQTQFGAVIRFP